MLKRRGGQNIRQQEKKESVWPKIQPWHKKEIVVVKKVE